MRGYLLTLFLMALVCASKAETHYKPHVSIGAHAGYDLSKVTFSPSVKQGWVDGLNMGVSVRYAEEKLVGIIAELNMEQRGWSELFEESPLYYHRKFTYVCLPVMTHVNFGSSRFRCFFNLGPEFSYMIKENTDANFDYLNPTSAVGWPNEPRMTEQLVTTVKNKFDYGIFASVGGEFYLRPRHSVYVEARYYFGLGNIFPSSKADTFSASRNMTVSVSLGYYFRIK